MLHVQDMLGKLRPANMVISRDYNQGSAHRGCRRWAASPSTLPCRPPQKLEKQEPVQYTAHSDTGNIY